MTRIAANLASLSGRFLVLDGPDGCGKSTQQAMLAERLTDAGLDVVCCRDPGGTAIGDRIRSVLLDYDLDAMNVRCETLLFMASRAQLVAEVIQPALASGKVVLCDRFVSSTCAYQGAAGFDPRKVIDLAWHAVGNLWPSLTILIDVDTDEAFRRIGRPQGRLKPAYREAGQTVLFTDAVHDAMESRSPEYHRRVREFFLELPGYYPRPVVVVDGTGPAEAVGERVFEAVRDHA
ncbi:MAG: Thymidylate kinase [Phycisphaerae bacterium]|nr:Thymidylate kinase [Phycisphaerae bacterium]